ncbi:MAG: PASTA domain-containing protein [Acidobacteriota bacterium]|nr:PASTA domain-containing protein [Acidobacteriota bacterium]
MKRIFTLVLGALAMIAVALVSAFITMRFAIHGREALVPALTGLSVADATKAARSKGLNLTLENRFYSGDVPAGRILAQDPAPGSRVRRDWPVRITESLGSQAVNIPELTGQSERSATVSIRRLSLDLGTVAHIAVPGDPDVVLTQTPPVNTAAVGGPRVSLLVSDPEAPDASAYVMPALVGLSYNAAAERAGAAGLRLVASSQDPAPPPPETAAPGAPPTQPPPPAPAQPVAPAGPSVVIAQTPQPGRRVVRGAAVQVLLGHTGLPALAQ